jgi:enoyl-CoA hydratase/carnithine racemase
VSVTITNKGAVRVLTFDRPEKLNAFDSAQYQAAGDAVSAAAVDDSVHALVLTGVGRAFSAGQDLDEMAALARGEGTGSNFPHFVDAIAAFPKPLLAAVNGLAIGIGFTMLAHCDLVLIDETARCRTPFTQLGVAPEAASSALFPARMGWQQAARVLFTSDWVSAAEAVQFGIALQTCAAGTVLAETLELATRIAAFPLTSLTATKKTLLDAQLPVVQRARQVEDAAFAELFGLIGSADAPEPPGR